ncbi:MAG: hypothetical protein R2710_17025 [Acidimicrobiales bacterium]
MPAAVTVNVLGASIMSTGRPLGRRPAVEGAQVHLYGKHPAPAASCGHVTAVGDDLDQAREVARRPKRALMGRRSW